MSNLHKMFLHCHLTLSLGRLGVKWGGGGGGRWGGSDLCKMFIHCHLTLCLGPHTVELHVHDSHSALTKI